MFVKGGVKEGFLCSGFAVAILTFLQMQHGMRNSILFSAVC